jgi:hypothetical protein
LAGNLSKDTPEESVSGGAGNGDQDDVPTVLLFFFNEATPPIAGVEVFFQFMVYESLAA